MEFKPNEAVLEYFKTGTQASWQTVTDAKVTKGSSVRLIENVWTGTGDLCIAGTYIVLLFFRRWKF